MLLDIRDVNGPGKTLNSRPNLTDIKLELRRIQTKIWIESETPIQYAIEKISPGHIGVKYSLIVFEGGGDTFSHVSVLTLLLVKSYLFYYFEMTLYVFVITNV